MEGLICVSKVVRITSFLDIWILQGTVELKCSLPDPKKHFKMLSTKLIPVFNCPTEWSAARQNNNLQNALPFENSSYQNTIKTGIKDAEPK